MNEITEKLLNMVSDWNGGYKGDYNIRVDGGCAGRESSEHVKIENKPDAPGLVIHVDPGTKGETVSIPACITHGGVDDLVYNDFYIGEGADITIVAGCGVHTEYGEPARHNGIHRFFLAPGSHALYIEKHVGIGSGLGLRTIDPVTEVFLEKDSVLEIDSAQIGGVDRTLRKTKGTVAGHGPLPLPQDPRHGLGRQGRVSLLPEAGRSAVRLRLHGGLPAGRRRGERAGPLRV